MSTFDLNDFIYNYFIHSIEVQHGFNFVNTLVYAAILIFAAFFVIYPLLERRGIQFNLRFMLSLLPYILFGITIRVLEDAGFFHCKANPFSFSFYVCTPGIWLFVAAITIASLLISQIISKKLNKNFYFIFAAIGTVIAIPPTIFNLILFKDWLHFFEIILLTLLIVFVIFIFFKKVLRNQLLQNRLNLLALSAQTLDGCATFVATKLLNCGEQHPLSEFLLNLWGPLFIIAKLLLIIVILWYVDSQIKNENLRGFIKIVIAIIAFATGLRDLFTVGIGTCG